MDIAVYDFMSVLILTAPIRSGLFYAKIHSDFVLTPYAKYLTLRESKSSPKVRIKGLTITRKPLIFLGRGSKIRTHDPRFWRPMLYQLSYTPVNYCVLLDTQLCVINQELFFITIDFHE